MGAPLAKAEVAGFLHQAGVNDIEMIKVHRQDACGHEVLVAAKLFRGVG